MARKAKKTNNTVTVYWNNEPQTEAEYISMGNELIAWAREETSLAIDGFPISKMIAPSIFHAIPAKSETFAQAYDLALGIIGLRREHLAHQGAINAHIVRETMPIYDRVYRRWLISEKNKEESVGQTKVIVVKYPQYLGCPDGAHGKERAEYEANEKLKMQEATQ